MTDPTSKIVERENTALPSEMIRRQFFKMAAASDRNGRQIIMEDVPEELQNHILGEFHIRKGRMNHPMGLELQSGHGMAIFVVTRQQLLDLAEECQKAAASMPKPS
jgi:hypothetical protein